MSMTRICVKNLPKYLTEERFREHFAAKGEVTDARIVRTSDGYSRQFGFIGYKTEDEAFEASKYFNRSFIDTCRLQVEIARPIGDSGIPRPWSRHSQGSTAFVKSHPEAAEPTQEGGAKGRKKGPPKEGEDEENDPALKEFLEVMQPRRKTKLWANDTAVGTTEVQKGKSVESKAAKGENGGKKGRRDEPGEDAFESDSGDESDLYEDAPGLASERGGRKGAEASDEGSDSEADEGGPSKEVDALNDSDYLKSRVKADWSDESDVEEGNGSDEGSGSEPETDSDEEDADKDRRKRSQGAGSSGEKARAAGHVGTLSKDGESDSDGDEETETAANGGDETLPGPPPGAPPRAPTQVDAEQEEGVSETGRLFVRNLAYTATEDDLTELFKQYGELSEVHLVVDKETKKSKGFAYVLYMLPEDAVAAMESLDRSIFQGRLLHILPARRPPSLPDSQNEPPKLGPGKSKVQAEREEQKKANEAAGDTRAWNSLFMNANTVAEGIAQRYGVSKSELLSPEAGDLAVRMALGETHIIAETKKALEEQGVDVGVLERMATAKGEAAPKRSAHVLLVKNLPFSTTDEEIEQLFERFGSLGRVVLPPTKTVALVEFLEAAEGRKAFKGLAYKRFKHVPLYLEWAPEGILSGDSGAARDAAEKRKGKTDGPRAVNGGTKVGAEKAEVAKVLPEDEEAMDEQTHSVFVKNLAFSTTEAALKKHFSKADGLRSVLVKMRPAKNGKALSMGFGFAEFASAEAARKAIQEMQGSLLDGHALVLQLSHKKAGVKEGADKKESKKTKASSTKIIVRNVAFEATKKDVRQLFSPFGQIKSLRLPKKFDGSHRGFAFVEFVTKQEAQNAFDAVRDTHLYGRHLVLEQAKEGEGLEELRARTAAQFRDGSDQGRPSKKIKLS
ncbi:hypothetical protein KFL_001300320, partial [Klebsormidium nitens]